MSKQKDFTHPYIPNAHPGVKKRMLDALGIGDVDNLFDDLPVRSQPPDSIPGPMSEYEIRRHIMDMLNDNREDLLVFCGAGAAPHYVPSIVDEIINRTEFKNTYTGFAESERGKWQALFEFQSLIAELIDMDVVNSSVYTVGTAGAEALNFARRLTARDEFLVPDTIDDHIHAVLETRIENTGGTIIKVAHDGVSGRLDLSDLRDKISDGTAGVWIDNPTALGVIEDQVDDIASITHRAGAKLIVSVEPSSLGILRPPGNYGADIVVGNGQSLGLHMNYGGNLLGFLGFRDEEDHIAAFPGNITCAMPTEDGRNRAMIMALMQRHFFAARENATSMVGSSSHLCAIGNAIYLSLLGPQGMRDIADGIARRTQYAMARLNGLPGVTAPVFDAPHFRDFTVNFDDSGVTVEQINRTLADDYGILGGKDLSHIIPALGQTALYCVTETHTREDIEALVQALSEIVGGEG